MESTLEKLEVYNLAEEFFDDIWSVVVSWDFFKKGYHRKKDSKICRFNFC